MSDWIKCNDRLPEEGQCVIASGHNFGDEELGRWVEPSVYADSEFHPCTNDGHGNLIADLDADMSSTTYWQPLPAPPTD